MLLNFVDNMFNLIKRVVFYIKIIIEAQQKDVPIYLICGIQTTSGSAFHSSHIRLSRKAFLLKADN